MGNAPRRAHRRAQTPRARSIRSRRRARPTSRPRCARTARPPDRIAAGSRPRRTRFEAIDAPRNRGGSEARPARAGASRAAARPLCRRARAQSRRRRRTRSRTPRARRSDRRRAGAGAAADPQAPVRELSARRRRRRRKDGARRAPRLGRVFDALARARGSRRSRRSGRSTRRLQSRRARRAVVSLAPPTQRAHQGNARARPRLRASARDAARPKTCASATSGAAARSNWATHIHTPLRQSERGRASGRERIGPGRVVQRGARRERAAHDGSEGARRPRSRALLRWRELGGEQKRSWPRPCRHALTHARSAARSIGHKRERARGPARAVVAALSAAARLIDQRAPRGAVHHEAPIGPARERSEDALALGGARHRGGREQMPVRVADARRALDVTNRHADGLDAKAAARWQLAFETASSNAASQGPSASPPGIIASTAASSRSRSLPGESAARSSRPARRAPRPVAARRACRIRAPAARRGE